MKDEKKIKKHFFIFDVPLDKSDIKSDAVHGGNAVEASVSPEESKQHSEAQPLRLEFQGSAHEYFRIWIVNLCLTLVTCGIFSAWAKVRKKRYFYSHTTLDGTPFQYLGQPIPILKGRVIATAIFFVYYASSHFFRFSLPYVLVTGAIIAPWMIIRSVAFNARYSAFRNMTFSFKGKYLKSAKVIYAWGLIPLLIAGTILQWWEKPAALAIAFLVSAFAFPLWIRRLRTFIIDHTAYGGKRGNLSTSGGQFFYIYFVAGLLGMAVAIITQICVRKLYSSGTSEPLLWWLVTLSTYTGYVLAYAYVSANITNLIWNNTQLGPLRFRSTLTFKGMTKLYVSNALGIITSFGLLIPWAVMRTLKYRTDNLKVLQECDLTQFHGRKSGALQAIGVETMDFFNVDLSL